MRHLSIIDARVRLWEPRLASALHRVSNALWRVGGWCQSTWWDVNIAARLIVLAAMPRVTTGTVACLQLVNER